MHERKGIDSKNGNISPVARAAHGSHASFFQPKLVVNQPGDLFEQEADTMADRVMRMRDDPRPMFFSPLAGATQLAGLPATRQIQRLPMNPEPTPMPGEIIPWSAALRQAPSPSARVLADLPRGHRVVVLGGRAWLWVNTTVGTGQQSGYVSHELIREVPVPDPPAQVPAPAPAPAPSPAAALGADFARFIADIQLLESIAAGEGYSFNATISALRKIYYGRNSSGASGGGAWDRLIPGAASVRFPVDWAAPAAEAAVDRLAAQPVRTIGGTTVDMGHLFAGLDAANHPAVVDLIIIRLQSNVNASTFVGDLGSVVKEYIDASTTSFRDTAMVRQNSLLTTVYGQYASLPDMLGNMDSFSITMNPRLTVAQNFINYYTASQGGVKQRYSQFAQDIGLGSVTNGRFTGDTSRWRRSMANEVFSAALAYALSKGDRGEVLLVLNEPGPGIFTPTFWEMYDNVSGWVVDEFVQRTLTGARQE